MEQAALVQHFRKRGGGNFDEGADVADGAGELFLRAGGEHADDADTAGARGGDAGGRVLEHDAVAGREAERGGTLEENFGIGFAVRNIFGGDARGK